MAGFIDSATDTTRDLHIISAAADLLPFEAHSDWLAAHGFTGKSGQVCLLPTGDVLTGAMDRADGADGLSVWTLAAVAEKLEAGTFRLASLPDGADLNGLLFGWAMARDVYKDEAAHEGGPQLVWPKAADRRWVTALAAGQRLVRRLTSAPANLLGPAELEAAFDDLGTGICEVTRGDDLLTQNFPAIHAVGRAATEARAPRLIDWRHGSSGPKITLVGKGVCFDTGGLDLKGAANMRLMKKDMGGAAHVLGLARAIVDAGLNVQLRVLIPAVENAVSAEAYRPGDVIDSRKGLTIEVGNTDAEGRIVLADALTLAGEDKPDYLIDFATLTGAARVAVGGEVAAYFGNDTDFSARFETGAAAQEDPVWQLPLFRPYARLLKSKFADICNISEGNGGLAGATTAALFLERFVPENTPWLHVDIMGYNGSARTGRPVGGEAMGYRAAFEMIATLAD